MISAEEWPYRMEPSSLNAILDGLKSRFFILAEFPLLSRELFPQNVLETAMKLQESEIRHYAIHLKGKELEGLILDLRKPLSVDEIKRASEILTFRISPRILKLLTVLFQYYETSPAVNGVLKAMADKTEERDDCSSEAAFIRNFGTEKDKISSFCKAIEERGRDIDRCFHEFSIMSRSPFAQRTVLAYLANASREELIKNLKWIVSTIENHEKEDLKALFVNYLSNLNLTEFHDGINLAILHKIGQPYTSPDWSDYEVNLRDKFAQWCFLHQLNLHSIGYPRKFSILGKYYDQVRNSYEIKEEKLMVIDFGDIVVADISEKPYSFFYEKSEFEKKMEMADLSFLRMDKNNLSARDFIIEEIEGPCVKLSYEGIDILYIQEMMDIKMGLEPDLRKKQLAKIKKKLQSNYMNNDKYQYSK